MAFLPAAGATCHISAWAWACVMPWASATSRRILSSSRELTSRAHRSHGPWRPKKTSSSARTGRP